MDDPKEQDTAKIRWEKALRSIAAKNDPEPELHAEPLYVQTMWHWLVAYNKVLKAVVNAVPQSHAVIEGALATLTEEQRNAVEQTLNYFYVEMLKEKNKGK